MCTYSKNQFRHLIMFFPIQHPQFARYPSLLNNMTNTRPPDVYVDREGHQWTLAAWAKPARFFLFHYPLLGLHMESQDSRKAHWTCQTRDCNFKWMMLKKEGWIYRRFEFFCLIFKGIRSVTFFGVLSVNLPYFIMFS